MDSFFTKGDVDAGIGIFFDAFTKLLIAVSVLSSTVHLSNDVIYTNVLPGVFFTALTVNGGLWIYHRYIINSQTKIALPAGIQSFRTFVWLFSIIVPTFKETDNALLSLQTGVVAHFLSGIIFIAGIYLMPYILKLIPDAALFGSLAAGALAFMILQSFDGVLSQPLLGLVALTLVFFVYFTGWQPRIPIVVLTITVAIVIQFIQGHFTNFNLNLETTGVYLPQLQLGFFNAESFQQALKFLPLIIVFSLDEVVTGMQALAQAKICGDEFSQRKPLLICGLADILGSLFGNPLAVGLYWGYPAWKKVGARTGYHLIALALYALTCLSGIFLVIVKLIPPAAVLPLLIFVGISSFAQTFTEFAHKYYPALILALIPLLVNFIGNNSSLENLSGLSYLYHGAPMLSLLISAAMIYLIDGSWLRLAMLNLLALLLTCLGIIHSPGLIGTMDYILEMDFIIFYGLFSLFTLGLSVKQNLKK